MGHLHTAVGQGVDEAADIEDRLLLDDVRAAADEQGGHQLPQGDVEALGGVCATTYPSSMPRSSILASTWFRKPLCSHMAPLGSPVEPEVK